MTQLLQLTPTQVSQRWDELSTGFVTALPTMVAGNESMRQTVMLDIAIREHAQVWAAIEDGEPAGYIYTVFHFDPVITSKNLLIYAVFSKKRTKVDVWKTSLQTLLKFAKANRCLSVMAYTQEQSVIHMVNAIGGNTETRLVYKEVL